MHTPRNASSSPMAAQPPPPLSSTPKMGRPGQCQCAPRWPSPSSNRRQCPRRQHHPVPWTRTKPSPGACTVSPRGSSTPGPRTAGAARTATLGDHTVVPLPWSTQRTMHLQTIVPQRKRARHDPLKLQLHSGPVSVSRRPLGLLANRRRGPRRPDGHHEYTTRIIFLCWTTPCNTPAHPVPFQDTIAQLPLLHTPCGWPTKAIPDGTGPSSAPTVAYATTRARKCSSCLHPRQYVLGGVVTHFGLLRR